MDVVLPDWLRKRAALTPGRLGLIAGGHAYTFAQMEEAVRKTAAFLAARGIGPGQRVALLLPNGPHFVWAIHALARLGTVSVPLNLRLTTHELAYQLAAAEVSGLLFHSTLAAQAGLLCAAHKVPALCLDQLDPYELDVQGAKNAPVQASELGTEGAASDGVAVLTDGFPLDRVHTIIFTSGTTGEPKGAMLTYGNHWWSAVGSVLNLGLYENDRWLAAVPLFHVSGLSILMRSVIYGIPAIVHERFDPERVNRAIDEDGVTIVSVVSSMLARMLDARGDRPYPETLRTVLVGGGPVPQPLLERCDRLGIPVVQTYGLSETASQVVTLSPDDAVRKMGSAGKPLFPVELQIVVDGRRARPFEAGEIRVRGPNVMLGYYNRPVETATALQEGWLCTGDIGYLDDEGYLYVLDRRTDLIISGGENVYPAEVEAALLAHPAVEEAAVVGRDDPVWGSVPVAFVKLRAGVVATEDELIQFARKRLAGYKVPKAIYFETELPKNSSGKLLRRALRERVQADG